MGVAKRTGPALRTRAPAPLILYSAPLVLPIAGEPIRDGAVAVRGERVLRVGTRDELLGRYRITEEHRWRGMIVAGLVDAYSTGTAPGPGVVARATELHVHAAPGTTHTADFHDQATPGTAYSTDPHDRTTPGTAHPAYPHDHTTPRTTHATEFYDGPAPGTTHPADLHDHATRGMTAHGTEFYDGPAPGTASGTTDPRHPVVAGVTYMRVSCESERSWEEHQRDALITAIRELDRPVGIAPRTRDPHVLEDVAVLARTFGLRLLVDLGRHSPAELDEAGVLGPHCHAACARSLDPGERKLLRLRGTTVALCPGPGVDEWPVLMEEGNRLAIGTGSAPGDVLACAAAIRARVRELGLRPRGLDRTLVEAATLGGARALGMASGPGALGGLRPGALACFAVFDARGRYPYSALMREPACLATIVGGRVHPA